MWDIKRILHATDFSQAAANAFAVARALARDYRAKLIIIHVVEPSVLGSAAPSPPDRESVEAQLRQIKAENPELTIEFRVAEGNPIATILDAAREIPCDLIVLGTHGRTQPRRLLMGSVAENVARNAACPVLTVTAADAPADNAPA